MAEKLEFDILVGKNELSKTLDQTSKVAGSISDALARGFGSAPIEEATTAVESLNKETNSYIKTTVAVAAGQIAYNLVSSAVNFLTSSIRESVAAYAEQEDAINKLRQAYALTGGATQSAIDGIDSFASSLEKTSRFSDDAIIRQVAFVKSLGASTEASKDLVLAAANLSATIGGSLEENTDKLGKTLSGTAGRLAQYIPELKSLTAEQLKAGEAARIINEKFNGSAASELKTYSGQMAALSNAFNNLQETMGKAIAESSVFQGILRATKTVIDNANNSVKLNATLNDYTSTGQARVSKTTEQLAGDYQVLESNISKLNQELLRLQKGGDINIVGISNIKGQIAELEKVRSEIEKGLQTPKLSTLGKVEAAPVIAEDPKAVEAVAKKNAELLALNQQFLLQKQNQETEFYNTQIENEFARNEAEIQRTADFNIKKAEIDAANKLAQAQATLTGDELAIEQKKIQAEKEIAINDAKNKRIIQSEQNALAEKKKIGEAEKAFQLSVSNAKNQIISQSFGLAAAIAKNGSKEQFLIQKAAALAEIGIADGKARALIPAQTAMIPYPANLAAIAQMNSLISIQTALGAATVAAQTIQGLATGGIVGGEFTGASGGGDNVAITARKDEMMLNAQQQKTLFDAINNGTLGGGNIQVIIDGREVAVAVRNQIQQGFRLA